MVFLLPLALAVEDFEGLSFYFGDLHSHTGGSNDGASGDLGDCDEGATCGDHTRWAEIARDESDLDFAAVVDHVNSVTNAADERDWPVVFASVVADIDRTVGFVGIPGAEVHFEDATTGDRYGHKSLLLFGDAGALGSISIHELQPNGDKSATIEGCAGIAAYFDRIVSTYGDALLLPHHPAASQPMSTDWACHDDRYEPAVEVYSEHGNSMTDDPTGFDPVGTRSDPDGTVTAAIDRFGLRLGFFGGSDNHDSQVYILSDVGRIAVRVHVPAAVRYPEGAGVVVDVPEFLNTPDLVGFHADVDATRLGLVQIEFLWPGWADDCCESEGVFDYGGPTDVAALRDVLRFALGDLPTTEGQRIDEIVRVPILLYDVGLWANSHPGMAAVTALALHGDDLGGVAWYIGRENPTAAPLASMEIGYWSAGGEAVLNPAWSYPATYNPENLGVDYSRVRWDPTCCADDGPTGRVWFDTDGDEARDPDEFTLGEQVPRMHDERYFSCGLIEALEASGSLDDDWPDDVASARETEDAWAFRESTGWFPEIPATLRVMLLFGVRDHVQPATDKPHVHQAWDGSTAAPTSGFG